MVNWKKVGLNLLYPHLAVIILLTPIAVAFLVCSLIYFNQTSILAILSYLLSFYVLLVVCFRVPRIIKFFKTVKSENKYVKRYLSDVRLRMNISLYGSLIWNVAFAVFQLWLGFSQNSLWFYSMFAYYAFLAVMRFFLVRHTRAYDIKENEEKEIKNANLCGWLLLVMNLALAVIITFIVVWNRTFHYHEITTITLAAYTFTTFTFAIINIVRYRKYESPVYSTAKAISLIAASVSMLTLETAMLTTFSTGGDAGFRQLMLALTGAAVTIFAITMAVIIIIKNTKKLKELKTSK